MGRAADSERRPRALSYVIHGPPAEVVEGSWPGSMVLIEFPGLTEARARHDSPANRSILHLRTDHIEDDLLLIEGAGPNHHPAERARRLQAEAGRASQSPSWCSSRRRRDVTEAQLR
ncbi:DUF1330 domain-containing protein [Streptomyces nojiriensis]|uniref:DUF1330 domain-containing protein n=1 Tax=Streptomyces nojiriensis TaxID=66374 RepID=UPI0035D5E6F9